jgi:peptide deformylase
MTLRKLHLYPDAPLKQVIPISEVSVDNLKSDVKDLIDTLKYYEGNAFITSNHVGLSKRIAVIDLQAVYQKEFSETDRFLVMVNPEILELSKDKMELNESAISTPDFTSLTTKSRSVKVKFDKIVLTTKPSATTEDEPKMESADNQTEVTSETEVKVITNQLDFDQFTFQTETLTFWEGLAYITQAAVNQLDGKCYLDTISWYNRERFIKKRRKMIKQFETWVKSNLMGAQKHRKMKLAR